MFFPVSSVLLTLVLLISFPISIGAQASPSTGGTQAKAAAPRSDLDAFMEKVLARREVNRKMLEQYVLDETETFEVLGPGQWPLQRTKRDYTWYERDGMHVRSPVRFDGVAVGEKERAEYEEKWIRREKGRQERKAKNEREKGEVIIGSEGIQVNTSGPVTTEPRFVSEAYFMDFKFEPGNYYLAGREKLEGQDVLRIEYYPTKLFSEGRTRPNAKVRERDVDIEPKMNKAALVTLWVEPTAHQILKYEFRNLPWDFLPGRSIVRVDDVTASMEMGQPFPDIWLPRAIRIAIDFSTAVGELKGRFATDYHDYRLASVSTRIR